MDERRPLLRELFFKYVGQTSSAPLGIEIKKAEGVFLYSADGKPYIDLVSGVSVSNIGHGNRAVIEAVKEQIEKYAHLMVYGEIIEAPQVMHAELLSSVNDPKLNCVYYVNSGSEANEAALKLAKRVTGRRELISCRNAYHGSTHGALSMMGSESFKNSFRPLLPCVRHIGFGDFGDLELITSDTAAVLIEPVQGEGGVILPPEGYMELLRKRCDQTGALLIFDEVQTGFGRCGSMFAYQKSGVVPDMMTLAKALGGGMPLGALVTSQELMKAWQTDPPLGHITTFGGHPVSCAAAYASLKYIIDNGIVNDVDRKAQRFRDSLAGHPKVKEIRNSGLLMAVDLGDSKAAYNILYRLLDEGVMTDWFLFQPDSFRIAPPLVISDNEIDMAVEKIWKALDRI